MPAITRAPIRQTSPISQTYLACEHRGAVHADGDLTKPRTDPPERIPAVPRWPGYRSPRRRTLPHSGRRGPNNSAARARIRRGSTPRPTLPSISKTVCQQPIPSSGWNTSPRSAGAPHRRTSRIALADRSTPNAGTPRPNQAGSQTSRTTTQFDHRPPHIATRASTAISFLSNPGGVRTTDASYAPPKRRLCGN